MTREAPTNDVDEARLEVGKPKGWAAGIPGVTVSLARSVEQMGVGRRDAPTRVLPVKRDDLGAGAVPPDPQVPVGEIAVDNRPGHAAAELLDTAPFGLDQLAGRGD